MFAKVDLRRLIGDVLLHPWPSSPRPCMNMNAAPWAGSEGGDVGCFTITSGRLGAGMMITRSQAKTYNANEPKGDRYSTQTSYKPQRSNTAPSISVALTVVRIAYCRRSKGGGSVDYVTEQQPNLNTSCSAYLFKVSGERFYEPPVHSFVTSDFDPQVSCCVVLTAAPP